MRNIEIKAPLADRADVEARLRNLGADEVWTRRQRDTFYAVPRGWLKLREEDDRPPELIAYQRATDASAPRASEYHIEALDDAQRWHSLLGHVLVREAVVTKERTLWQWRHTRVHLDRVDSLGDHIELETVLGDIDEATARAEADEVIRALALDPATFIAVPYKLLLER